MNGMSQAMLEVPKKQISDMGDIVGWEVGSLYQELPYKTLLCDQRW